MGHVRFNAGAGIDNHKANAIGAGRFKDAAQLGRVGFHQRRRFRLTGSPPGGGTALGIKIDQQRTRPFLMTPSSG